MEVLGYLKDGEIPAGAALVHEYRIEPGRMLTLKSSDRHASQTQRRAPAHIPKMPFKVLSWYEYEAGCVDAGA